MSINWEELESTKQTVLNAINEYYKVCHINKIPANYKDFLPEKLIEQIISDSKANNEDTYQTSDWEDSY